MTMFAACARVGPDLPRVGALDGATADPPGCATAGSLADLERKYGIEIHLSDPPAASWPQVGYKALSEAQLGADDVRAYSRMLAEELGKYPVGLVRLADLRQVSLVSELGYEGQLRAALPDFVKEILYLDVYRGRLSDSYRGRARGLYRRHVVHHEFYHLLEEEVFQDVYYKDPAWAALNPSGFSYGSGGAKAQSGPQFELVHPQPGFINRYAMSGLEEDKAEIFAALMLPAEARKLAQWSVDDPALKAKVAAMKAFLAERVPALNTAFWDCLNQAETR